MRVRHPGFTLLELIVVIAIVAVLSVLFMPVYGKIQVSARTVQCQARLRQVGAALLAHASEHDGYFPTAGGVVPWGSTDPSTGLPGWTEQLTPYVGTNRDIFKCPASYSIVPSSANYGYFMGCRAAYIYNGNQYGPLRLPLIQATSKYIIAGDIASDSVFTNQGLIDADKDDYTLNPAFAPMTRIFHGKKSNLVFADGHVGGFVKFDRNQMTVRYGLRPDGTGYDYSDP